MAHYPVPVLCWDSNTTIEGGYSFIQISDNDYTAQEAADFAIPRLNERPPEARVLLIRSISVNMCNTSSGAELISLVTNGVDLAATQTWLQSAMSAIASGGGDVTAISLDLEDTFTRNASGVDQTTIQGVLDDVGAAAMVPAHVKAHTAAELASASAESDDWSLWSFWEVAHGLRAFKAAAEAGIGHKIDMYNYKDQFPGFHAKTRSSRVQRRSCIGSIGGQNLYPENSGSRYTSRTKHIRWNSIIDCFNRARASAAVGQKLRPWIAAPSYESSGNFDPVHRYSFDLLVKEAWASGCIQGIQFFNPDGNAWQAEDYVYAEGVFKSLHDIPKQMKGPVEWPLDSDYLPATGVTYEEALPNLPQDAGWFP